MSGTTAGVAAATFFVIALLGACSTGSRHAARPSPPQPSLQPEASGQTHYDSYCAGCHHADGKGVEAEAPPLAGSEWVSGPEERLIRILLHGVRGPIEVAGKTYNREMPGFGQVMTDAGVASLASYVRSQFGAVTQPVEATAVSRIRAAAGQRQAPWTADELRENR